MGFFLKVRTNITLIKVNYNSQMIVNLCALSVSLLSAAIFVATHYLFRLLGNDSYLLWRTEKI
uniref:Uncharacterized protein n=1 Tax=Anguilla anguilla TaxID=7936 RepID=A0A0E9XGA4_ANGAN